MLSGRQASAATFFHRRNGECRADGLEWIFDKGKENICFVKGKANCGALEGALFPFAYEKHGEIGFFQQDNATLSPFCLHERASIRRGG